MDKKIKDMPEISLNTDKPKEVNYLTDDHLRAIFQYLSVKEKIIASFVSKKWNHIIHGSWKSLIIDEEIQKEFTKDDKAIQKFLPFVQKFLQKYSSNLTTLSLTANYNYNLDYLGVLKEIEKYCKNLTKLILIDYTKEKNIFTDKSIAPLFRNNINLRKIHLKNINIGGNCLSMVQPKLIEEFIIDSANINSKFLCNFLKQLKNIKVFNYRAPQYNNQLMTEIVQALNKSGCENISEFNIVSDHKIDGLSELIFKQKKIKILKLKDDIIVDKEFLDKVQKQNLEVLEIEFRGNLGYYPLSEFNNLKVLKCSVDVLTEKFMKGLTKCKNLRDLNIYVYNQSCDNDLTKTGFSYFSQLLKLDSFKIHISDEEVDNILKALSRLKYLNNLNFDECKFSGTGFDRLYPKSFQNLKNLSVVSTNISEKELIDLVSKSPKLEKINVSSCEKITEEFCKAVNKIKNDRKDGHILKLNVYEHDKIYKVKESYKNSLILIEHKKSGPDFPEWDQLDPNSSVSEVIDFVRKFSEIYFNVPTKKTR